MLLVSGQSARGAERRALRRRHPVHVARAPAASQAASRSRRLRNGAGPGDPAEIEAERRALSFPQPRLEGRA